MLNHRSVLVPSFGVGTTGHEGCIAVDANFDLVRHQRLIIQAPSLAVFHILRPILDGAARAVMNVVFVQNALKDGGIRFGYGLTEVLD